MTTSSKVNGVCYARMVAAGAAELRVHEKEVNDLNVFPIPDGDTGDNMLLTIMGGIPAETAVAERLDETARQVSGGMLLSARGNSGVILSQFFAGLAHGFEGQESASAREMGEAFRQGVAQAYRAVMEPTEGTVLTVMREATEFACGQETETPQEFLEAFLTEARASLARTPELLAVLKRAGVVDSGGAGLVLIAQGMLRGLLGEEVALTAAEVRQGQEPDLDAFGEDSVLEFGYCTELLLRLQRAKTDLETFDVKVISDYLATVGDSIVAVRSGSMVKLHVHTVTPHLVLAFCQQYGEFLKVKIENMSLQHNSTVAEAARSEAPSKERKPYGVVAVASGEGLRQTFLERGADVIVDGGQSMNPSAEAFLEAFDRVNADTVFVFPNNGNIILTAKQAAGLYPSSDVRVIESHTVGAGYAALSMLDTGSGDTDTIVAELTEAMQGVVTAEISRCVRDADMAGRQMHAGDYIGFVGKELLAVSGDRFGVVCETADRLELARHDICILICGKDAAEEEAARVETYLRGKYRGLEVYLINGMQEIYDYILIVE